MSPDHPEVRLGRLVEGGLAPAILAIVDRGVLRHPSQAAGLQAEIELQMEGYPPVTIAFADGGVLIEDGPAAAPDLRLWGTLTDLVSLLVAPLIGGLPNPIDRRGRAAIGMVAQGRVKFDGSVGLLRRLLSAIRI